MKLKLLETPLSLRGVTLHYQTAEMQDHQDAEEAQMKYLVVKRDELSRFGDTYELEGYRHGNTPISLILVDLPPGEGPKLHAHPYEEVFVIQQGCATYTVGSTTLEAQAGQIVIVPAGVPHKFINSDSGRLVQVDIHHSPQFITQWLED